eukprot:CAMPEP_0167755960 /NCGR_PEP_ID=MMETSP0110_2-20121227/9110_1 /TAXON_ID=629695 /ORGANISM="Gymnochlora sp., Strain CCMP2014" /LENGTH=62 /DNA_ID=CAMNT_0007641997 /DNA_START=147 /DNA_END=335 /DNA_ORIENTATION=-
MTAAGFARLISGNKAERKERETLAKERKKYLDMVTKQSSIEMCAECSKALDKALHDAEHSGH